MLVQSKPPCQPRFDFRDHNDIVTGGSRSIGLLIADAVLTALLSTLSMRTNRCGETLRALRLADIEGAHLCLVSPSVNFVIVRINRNHK